MQMKTLIAIGIMVLTDASSRAAEIEVSGVLVKLLEQAEIPALEPGVVTAIKVSEGSIVKAGDVLASIDDSEAVFAQRRAEVELSIAKSTAENTIALRSAEKSLKLADEEYARAKEANDKFPNTISTTEIDRMRLAADQATLTVEKARHEVSQARLLEEQKAIERDFAIAAVKRRQVTSPFEGVVVSVTARRGEWVKSGEKLMRLIRVDRLRVEGTLEAKHADPKLVGTEATLVIGQGSSKAQFKGRITFVSPEIDPFSRQVRIMGDFENPKQSLRPGERGTLILTLP